ncbi:hypothetical protein RYA05_00475 [Pseudomonas syringae pv. actinidiae]|nr:hypothetical protein [Pseudomonas syringae pv. actinidiae]
MSKIIFSIQGSTKDKVKYELAVFEATKEGVKGLPATLSVGMQPSRPCTLYFNKTDKGVLAELRGPIPKLQPDGAPILNVKEGREYYEFETYKDKEKERWIEAPLGTFGIRAGATSGKNYVMGKMYHHELLMPMARLLYAIRNSDNNFDPQQPDKPLKSDHISALNDLQSDRNASHLVNLFPTNGFAASKASKLFEAELSYVERTKTPESSGPSM